MRVEKKSYEQHPEGWFLFLLGEPEVTDAEWKGKKSSRLKWPCTSSEFGDEGNNLIVNLFTGIACTDHPEDKHRQLVEDGFGMSSSDYEDTDEISGKFFAGKVEHKKETGRAIIVQFDTMERIKAKRLRIEETEYVEASTRPKKKSRAEVDPFLDE